MAFYQHLHSYTTGSHFERALAKPCHFTGMNETFWFLIWWHISGSWNDIQLAQKTSCLIATHWVDPQWALSQNFGWFRWMLTFSRRLGMSKIWWFKPMKIVPFRWNHLDWLRIIWPLRILYLRQVTRPSSGERVNISLVYWFFFILKSMLRPHQNGSKSKFERNIIGSKVNEPVGYKSWQTFTHRLRNVTANISLPQLPQDQAYPTGSKGYGPTDYKGYFSIMWWKRLKIPGGTIIFDFHRQWLRNSHEPLGFLHLSVKGLTLPQSPNKGIGCDQRR